MTGQQRSQDQGWEIARIGSGSMLSVIGVVVSQLASFGTMVAIGRAEGANELGIYAQAFAVRALLVVICVGGMRSAMTRFVAIFLRDGDLAALHGTIRLGLWFSGVLSAVCAIGLYLGSDVLANSVFDEPDLVAGIRYAALSLVPSTVMLTAINATQGFRSMRAYALIGSMLEPGLRFLGAGVALSVGAGVDGCLAAFAVSPFVSAGAALFALRRLATPTGSGELRYPWRAMGRFALLSWLSSVSNQGLLWTDSIILGAYLPSDQVGVYQVATRAVLLATIASTPLNASFAPHAAHLWEGHSTALLQRAYGVTSDWLVRISVPMLAIAVVFPNALLSVFFDEADGSGATVIRVLASGALFEVWASTAGVTLNMTGHNAVSMLDAAGALALNVTLNILLIPRLGIVGSAWAWSISLIAYGIVRPMQVRRFVSRIEIVSTRTVQSLLAGVLAAGAAVVVEATAGDNRVGASIGAIVVLTVYGAVIAGRGLDDDELRFIGSILPRSRAARPRRGAP